MALSALSRSEHSEGRHMAVGRCCARLKVALGEADAEERVALRLHAGGEAQGLRLRDRAGLDLTGETVRRGHGSSEENRKRPVKKDS